jgi:aspartyl-tRNA synthetase
MHVAAGRLRSCAALVARSTAHVARAGTRPACAHDLPLPHRATCGGARTPAAPQRSAPAPARRVPCLRVRPAARSLTHAAAAFAKRAAAGASTEEAPASLAGDMTWPERDCGCGELRDADVGRRVTLCGWVDKQRNMGAVVFADVRDHTGIVQARRVDGETSTRMCSDGWAPRP